MSNLRTALEELITDLEGGDWYDGTAEQKGAADAYSGAASRVRAILAAHPDTTATEWGVMYEDDLIVKEQDEDSAHLRKAVSIVKNTVIVSRTIGPWQVAK